MLRRECSSRNLGKGVLEKTGKSKTKESLFSEKKVGLDKIRPTKGNVVEKLRNLFYEILAQIDYLGDQLPVNYPKKLDKAFTSLYIEMEGEYLGRKIEGQENIYEEIYRYRHELDITKVDMGKISKLFSKVVDRWNYIKQNTDFVIKKEDWLEGMSQSEVEHARIIDKNPKLGLEDIYDKELEENFNILDRDLEKFRQEMDAISKVVDKEVSCISI